jgi:hypothetical protein
MLSIMARHNLSVHRPNLRVGFRLAPRDHTIVLSALRSQRAARRETR